MEQLDENLRAMASSKFAPADEKILAAQLQRSASSIAGCAAIATGRAHKGLPVADMLRYLMYAENYGEFALGRDTSVTLPVGAASVRCKRLPGVRCSARRRSGVFARLIRAQEYLHELAWHSCFALQALAGSEGCPSCSLAPGWTAAGPRAGL